MDPFATLVPSAYDLRLVALSYFVAVIASYAALDLAGRVAATYGRTRTLWLSCGAVTMGLGIWSMHFIGMLALQLAMPVNYNIPLVITSFLIAVAAAGFALVTASRPTLARRPLIAGGVCLGLGIAAMHYIGMAAMDLDGSIHYRPLIVGASIIIAISAAIVALWSAFQLRNLHGSVRGWVARKLGSACLMGAAIAGMHYTGLAAAVFTTEHSSHTLAVLDTSSFTIALVLSIATLIIVGIALLSALIDRRFSTQIASFESLFLLNPDAIFALDLDGSLRRANPAATRLTGYACEVMPARPLDALLTPADRERLNAQLQQAAHGSTQQGDYVFLKQSGQQLIGHATMVPIVVGAQISGIYTIIRDITERKQAELALSAAEVRFRTLIEQLPVISYITALDQTSSSLYTSPQIETMLGFTQAEWMADHQLWSKRVHPDDLPAVQVTIEHSHTSGTPTRADYRMLTRSGAVKWFRDEWVIIHDAADQPLFLQGIMFDITELKQAEAALRHSETRNRALINAMPDLLLHLDKTGVLLDYKADHLSDLVLPPAEQLGKKIVDLLPPHVKRLIMSGIDGALATGITQVVEYPLVLNKSASEFEARIMIYGVDEILVIVRNITERKQMERMKNEFVATVSHELRTPLTSIHGSLGLIAGGVAGSIPPNVQRLVAIASRNSDRLLRLINDILDIEKIESGKLDFNFQPMQLLPLVAQTIEANRAYGAQFNVMFALESSTHDSWVNVDSDRLIQALTNLLANAAKFSPPGDTVLVRVSRRADLLRVAISDHGPGIPESFRDQLFEKFAQADASNTREKGGTGLGLSITKAIIEKLGGVVGYAPNQAGGATFWIDMPACQAPALDTTGVRAQQLELRAG